MTDRELDIVRTFYNAVCDYIENLPSDEMATEKEWHRFERVERKNLMAAEDDLIQVLGIDKPLIIAR